MNATITLTSEANESLDDAMRFLDWKTDEETGRYVYDLADASYRIDTLREIASDLRAIDYDDIADIHEHQTLIARLENMADDLCTFAS